MKFNSMAPLATALAVLSVGQAASATTISIKNNCGGSITVYVGGASYATLGSGASTSVSEGVWNGRIQDNMTAGASLSEWNLNASGTDWYDVSYVDGMDNPIGIQVSNSSCSSPNKCTSFSCPTKTNGPICESPCTAYQTAQYCCSGADNTSATCNEAGWPAPGSTWVNDIHSNCPGEYSYAYDDNVGLHTCPTGPSYTVTFCPGGSSSSSSTSSSSTSSTSSTSGGTIANGVHSLTPACATGARLDDSGAGTANGNPVVIYQSNGTNAQNWNFANVGGTEYNMAVNLGPYCLDDDGGGSGVQTVVWSCNGGNNQKWNASSSGVVPAGDYNFFNMGDSLCLDVSGAGSANNTKVITYACNGTNAQAWKVQ